MLYELERLRQTILGGQVAESLALIEELDGMSRKAIISTIESFIKRLLVHLIKNQAEQRLTNSWVASIQDSIIHIQKLNLQDNRTSVYIQRYEWAEMLAEAFQLALFEASIESFGGIYTPFELSDRIEQEQVLAWANRFIELTYQHPTKGLPQAVQEMLNQLPGGEAWGGRRKQ